MKKKEQMTCNRQDMSMTVEEYGLVLERNNGLGIVLQCIAIIIWIFLFSGSSYGLFIVIFKGIESMDLKTLFIAISIMGFGSLFSGWALYATITQIIAENFSIKLYEDFFIFKSILINEKVAYADIKEAYIIQRGKETRTIYYFKKDGNNKSSRYRYYDTKVLKIRRTKGFNLFICLNLVNKKEELMLKGILKQKLGKKIREKHGTFE